ncbi:hypothetical protein C5Y96_13590 [Blastopirellula marina]|uniref:HEAT repeat domain-containing protein n=1 Tax=Blastopirellula marina TaxID=124 RepID=A0A2S8FGR2_9BACT|nr:MULTISPECIES: hypothetical protein [Pirellulaceae]PQO31368.1 hypothetical protein C5Y96_13590 [Blastopirellula marina]RCS51762.1 hypothetical protein DTL36_13600 [Bremerella cremea]
MQRFLKIAFTIALLVSLVIANDALAQQPEQPAPVAPVDTAAIQALKESNPTTAEQLINAAIVSADLGRGDLGKAYLAKLIENDPAVDEVLAAQQKLGSGRIFRLQSIDALQPEGARAATLLLTKLDAYYKDPARLSQLVDQLIDKDEVARNQAAKQLKNAGAEAANPLFVALADPSREAVRPAAKRMLVQMDQAIHGPLLAALDSSDPLLVAELVDVAKQLDLDRAAQFLVGPYVLTDDDQLRSAIGEYLDATVKSRPTADDVKAYLAKRVKMYLGEGPMFPVNEDGLVELWTWDAAKKQVVMTPVPPADAEVVTAGQLLRDLYALDETNAEVQVQAALAAMQRMGVLGESDVELKKLVDKHGVELLQSALTKGLEDRKFAQGAVVACEQIGATKNADLLIAVEGKLSPLALALQSPVYRVRRAAAKGILTIDPKAPYAGSAELLDTLDFMASAQGKRNILLGELHQQNAQRMAGLLSELQLEPLVTPGGREFFKQAHSSPDVEAIFISKPLALPAMMETVQILRKDRRTAEVPIGIIAPIGEVVHYQLRTKDDPLTIVMIRPNDVEGFIFQLKQLYLAQGRLLVPADEREADAEFAFAQISRMLDTPDDYDFYDFLKVEEIAVRRLADQNVAADVASLLGKLGTPIAQTALIDYASDPFYPINLRQACADALKSAIERRGILLTKDQIVAQYDRYNASEELDPETQAVLGKILDILEAPTQDVRFDQPAKIGP